MQRLSIIRRENGVLLVYAHKATRTYDDSIIYTLADTFDSRYRFKFGTTKLDALIWSLYRDNKFFYATNEVGEIVADYMRQAKYR